MRDNLYPELTQLGHATVQPNSPDAAVLERVPNPDFAADYVVRFSCPEFTSLCAVTGQPDFAHIVIDIIPDEWNIESKSLKIFLTSFRNHSGFHEACTMLIGRRLIQALSPRWLRIGIHAVAFLSTCSGKQASRHSVLGFQLRTSHLIADAAKHS